MTLKITTDNISPSTLQTLGGGVKITSLTYPNSATAANPAGGETITVTGSGFNSGAVVYVDTGSCTTTYVSSTSLTFTSPAKSVASYFLYVYNTDGSSGVKPAGIVYSAIPVWVTSAGALTTASQNASYSQTVSVTGDGTITYALTTGSLPTGLSLNTSTGEITGTPTVVATSNFTITASDSQSQTASRSFSIQVIVPVVSSVEYIVIAGAGGGGAWLGGGGGAGGLLAGTGYAITTGTPVTVTVGGGGPASSSGSSVASSGTSSAFGTVSTTGGGGGASHVSAAASNGGSGGGGADNGSAQTAGLGIYPGSSYISGIRQGYNGGNGSNNSDYTDSGGGGGGAGGAGVSSNTTNVDGDGGLAYQWSDGNYYAGGGGAGTGYQRASGRGGYGGGTATVAQKGGAGDGGFGTGAGTAGTAYTGGGGGGGGNGGSGNAGVAGGNGGAGVVIIRYNNGLPNATSTTGSPALTNTGGYKYYTFNASGSITF